MSDPESLRTPPASLARLTEVPLTEADLATHQRELSKPLATETGARVMLLCFRAAGERFALPASCIDRVFHPQPVRRVPHRRHSAFRGLVAHEGEILPLGSLERLLDLSGASNPAQVQASSRVLAIGPAGRAWAFEADQVDGVLSLADQDLRPAPVTVTRRRDGATRMLARLPDGGEAAVLDPEALREGWEAALR